MNGTQAASDMGAMLGSYLPLYFSARETMDASRTFLGVMTAVVIFDYAVTVPSEIKYVWRKPMTWLNACLLLNRYGIIIELTVILYLFYFPKGTLEDCRRVYLYESYAPSVVLLFANILLMARVYALNKKNKMILGVLCILLAAEMGVHIWNPLQSSPMTLPTGIPEIGLPDIRGCIPGEGTEFYYLNFLFQVIFDAVAFSFALVPCITDWQKSLKSGLGKVLIRDGTGFFALCLAANLANIPRVVSCPAILPSAELNESWLAYMSTSLSVTLLQIYFAQAGEFDNKALCASLATGIQSIAAGRMVFNLREASHQGSSTSGISRLTGSAALAGGGLGSRLSNLTRSKEGDSRQDLNMGPMQASHSVRLQPFQDPLDASEKGYELDVLAKPVRTTDT